MEYIQFGVSLLYEPTLHGSFRAVKECRPNLGHDERRSKLLRGKAFKNIIQSRDREKYKIEQR